jgi:hypothetical protein
MLSLLPFLNVLMFLNIGLAALCCFLIIRLPFGYWLKFTTIPFIIAITFVLVMDGENLFGRPYPGVPQGQFEFKDYRVVSESEKKIELWVIQNKESRLYVFKYDPEFEQQLATAKGKTRKGAKMKGEFKGDRKGSGRPGSGSNYKLNIEETPLTEILPPKNEQE